MALASSKLIIGKRPPAWPMIVRLSPVLPKTRLGMSPALILLASAPNADTPKPAAADEDRNVLRRIRAPSIDYYSVLHNFKVPSEARLIGRSRINAFRTTRDLVVFF